MSTTKPVIPRGTLPAFTPVPRQTVRHNGWSPEVQKAFIEALADTGSVTAACRAVNRADHGVYLLRRHPEAGEFRKAWEAALALGVKRIEDVAMDRALNGVEVPVYHFGQIVGTRRVYNDSLLMFMLRNRAPKRFAADNARGMNAVDNAMIKRLKVQWRKEWEKEHAIKTHVDSEKIIQSINAKLGKMKERRLAGMSDRTRELMEAYEASEKADARSGSTPALEDRTSE